ncbi:hypothetical protein Fmac_014816 [Flemingia macrophylla]|uniref:Uncharacterized protein n=1 Tax=Flemingia macrophylla TaxID=520843 RepID=A0ABD1MDL6_9FABA
MKIKLQTHAGSVACSLACISCYAVELSRTLNQCGKPPGVWKTLLGVIHCVDNGTGIAYGGLTLEHNFLGMFHSLQFTGQPLSHLAFSYDGQRLALGSLDEIIKVWDVSRNFEGLNLEGLGRSIEVRLSEKINLSFLDFSVVNNC